MNPKKKEQQPEENDSELSVKAFDRELLRRLSAAAAFIGIDKSVLITRILRREMKKLEQAQKETQDWWRSLDSDDT